MGRAASVHARHSATAGAHRRAGPIRRSARVPASTRERTADNACAAEARGMPAFRVKRRHAKAALPRPGVTRTGMRWADHPRRAPVRLPYKVDARRCVKPMVRTASVRSRGQKIVPWPVLQLVASSARRRAAQSFCPTGASFRKPPRFHAPVSVSRETYRDSLIRVAWHSRNGSATHVAGDVQLRAGTERLGAWLRYFSGGRPDVPTCSTPRQLPQR